MTILPPAETEQPDTDPRNPRGCLILFGLLAGFWFAVGVWLYQVGAWDWAEHVMPGAR